MTSATLLRIGVAEPLLHDLRMLADQQHDAEPLQPRHTWYAEARGG
jgi:hypothetical protein